MSDTSHFAYEEIHSFRMILLEHGSTHVGLIASEHLDKHIEFRLTPEEADKMAEDLKRRAKLVRKYIAEHPEH
jgi:hypothetical protein